MTSVFHLQAGRPASHNHVNISRPRRMRARVGVSTMEKSLSFVMPLLVGAALVAFAVLRQQYAMTGFFLRRFPRLSPAKALSRSREAVRRRPWLLPEMRLHTLGWRLFGALGVSIPFVLTYTALTDQLCQQRIFEKS